MLIYLLMAVAVFLGRISLTNGLGACTVRTKYEVQYDSNLLNCR